MTVRYRFIVALILVLMLCVAVSGCASRNPVAYTIPVLYTIVDNGVNPGDEPEACKVVVSQGNTRLEPCK